MSIDIMSNETPLALAATANHAVVQEHIDGYQYDDGESAAHTPSDFERLLIADAIEWLLADPEFVRTFCAWQALAAPAPQPSDQVLDAMVDKAWSRFESAQNEPATKATRVHALVNQGPYPGMSEAFDAHMGAACWTDRDYAQDAATWAAAWKAALSQAPSAEAGNNFAAALAHAMGGKRITRAGWNGKGQHVEAQYPDANSRMSRPYLVLKNVDDDLVPWVPSQGDLFANDWTLCPTPETA